MSRQDSTRTNSAKARTLAYRQARAHKAGHTVTNSSGRARRTRAYSFTLPA